MHLRDRLQWSQRQANSNTTSIYSDIAFNTTGTTMVKYGRIERPIVPEDEALPIELRELTVDGISTLARPYDFINGVPHMYATTCPQCGHGIFVDLAMIVAESVSCDNCGAGKTTEIPAFIDPFVNPIIAGKIAEYQLDPDLDPDLAIGEENDDVEYKSVLDIIRERDGS